MAQVIFTAALHVVINDKAVCGWRKWGKMGVGVEIRGNTGRALITRVLIPNNTILCIQTPKLESAYSQ